MQKYPGPKDQHKIIERRYIVRIVVGLSIMATGLVATIFGMLSSEATILAPPIGAGEEAVEIRTIDRPDPLFGIIFVVAGTAVNLYSISRYRSEYSEIRDKEPRPEGIFIAVGLISTIIVAGLVGYTIIVFQDTALSQAPA